MRIEIP